MHQRTALENPVRRLLLLVLSLDLPLTILAVGALVRLLHLSPAASSYLAAMVAVFYLGKTVLYVSTAIWRLEPFLRWERARREGGDDLVAAHAAVARAPLALSFLFSALWGLTFSGALFAFNLLGGQASIEVYEVPAIILYLVAILLGTFVGAYVVHAWALSPLMAEVSAAAKGRCSGLPGSEISLRARLVLLLLTAMLGPSAWIASFGYVAEVRSMIFSAQYQAEGMAKTVAREVTAGSRSHSIGEILSSHQTAKVTPFLVTTRGEVIRAPDGRAPFDERLRARLQEKTSARDRGHWFDAAYTRVIAFERTSRGDLAVAAVHVPHLYSGEFAGLSMIFGLILLLWASVVARFLSEQLSRQIASINKVVGAVEEAETPRGSPRVPLYDHHEIGFLAESINGMLDRLERSEDASIEIERFKDEFIRMTAHELKTPITIVKGYAQLLRSAKSEDTRRRSIAAILRGTERMDHIVSELVDICRIRAGRYVIRREAIDLNVLVAQIASRATERTGRTIHFSQHERVIVEGDRSRLADVCSVLIDNAITYSPQETPVEIDVTGEGDQAVLSVADHGIGIPPEKRAHILEPFRRAHAETPHDRGGLGVALYLSRLIVERHGGRIWFESQEGRGTRFSVALPAAKKDQSDGGAEDRAGHRG